MRTQERPYRLLVADAGGSTTRLLSARGEEIQADVVSFAQPAMLAANAAQDGGDLILMVEPPSLAPLERLKNDPRTRHISVILLSSTLDTEEKRFAALTGADQILDYPSEEKTLIDWIVRGLKGQLHRSNLLDYAIARMKEPGESQWTGRINWVAERTLRFETNVVPEVGSLFPLSGPLFSAVGLETCTAQVLAVAEQDVFYNHGARLTLEIPEHINISLIDFCNRDRRSISKRKTKLGVLCESGASLAKVASLVDSDLYAIRWVKRTDGLAAALAHINPALLLIDPNHSDLADPMKAAALTRLPKTAPRIVPLAPPEEMRLWNRLGDHCATTEVPELDESDAWNDLLKHLLVEVAKVEKEGRVYLRRDHPYSHARLTIPCALYELSEAGCAIRTMCKVVDDARARITIPTLMQHGLQPCHGRVLSGEKAEQKLQIVWMGVGGNHESTKLRRYVSEVIMTARREEYNA